MSAAVVGRATCHHLPTPAPAAIPHPRPAAIPHPRPAAPAGRGAVSGGSCRGGGSGHGQPERGAAGGGCSPAAGGTGCRRCSQAQGWVAMGAGVGGWSTAVVAGAVWTRCMPQPQRLFPACMALPNSPALGPWQDLAPRRGRVLSWRRPWRVRLSWRGSVRSCATPRPARTPCLPRAGGLGWAWLRLALCRRVGCRGHQAAERWRVHLLALLAHPVTGTPPPGTRLGKLMLCTTLRPLLGAATWSDFVHHSTPLDWLQEVH